MKIKVTKPSDLYEGAMEIELTTNKAIRSVRYSNGEPEDNCLARDLSCTFNIPEMLEMAYQAGKDGEELIIENLEGE